MPEKSGAVLLIFFYKLDCVFDGLNFFSLVIRNFNAEFLFKRHDKFYDVKTVSTQIFNKPGLFLDLFGTDIELLNDNLFDIIKNSHLFLLKKK